MASAYLNENYKYIERMTQRWDKMTTGDSHVEGTQEFFAL